MWTSLLCCDKNCFIQALPVIGMRKTNLYVQPEYRGNGYGKAILTKLAAIAVERGCGRLEWNKPSIEFYRSLGAQPMDEWTVYRIAGDTLTSLAGE